MITPFRSTTSGEQWPSWTACGHKVMPGGTTPVFRESNPMLARRRSQLVDLAACAATVREGPPIQREQTPQPHVCGMFSRDGGVLKFRPESATAASTLARLNSTNFDRATSNPGSIRVGHLPSREPAAWTRAGRHSWGASAGYCRFTKKRRSPPRGTRKG